VLQEIQLLVLRPSSRRNPSASTARSRSGR
jgi:hypothetical protein